MENQLAEQRLIKQMRTLKDRRKRLLEVPADFRNDRLQDDWQRSVLQAVRDYCDAD
jgi:hypothetical protein